MIRALNKKYNFSLYRAPLVVWGGRDVLRKGGEECNNFPRPRNLPNWSEIYRYVFSYWLYKYIFFYFHPLSSSSSSVWKQLLGFRCWHEVTRERGYRSTYLLYRCVRLSFLSDVAARGGVGAWLGGSERKSKGSGSVRQRETWHCSFIGGGVIQEQTHQLEEHRLVTWPAGRPYQGVCISGNVARADALHSQNTWTIQLTINTWGPIVRKSPTRIYQDAFTALLESRLSLS